MYSSTLFAFVASLAVLSTEVVVATPPACLLACVAQVGKSSSQCNSLNDVACFCKNENSEIKDCLDSVCPNGNADAAYSAFQSSCSEQNAAVSAVSQSSSSSSSTAQSSSTVASSTSTSTSTSETTTYKATSSSKTTAAAAETTTSVAPSSTTTASSSSTLEVVSKTSSSSSFSSASILQASEGAANALQVPLALGALAALLI